VAALPLPPVPKRVDDKLGFPVETPQRIVEYGETRLEAARETTTQAMKRHRSGNAPDASMVRRVMLDENGEVVPLETKPAFAALDLDIEDIDIASELLGRFSGRGRRFNTVKFSKQSPKALYALGFDPMVELVKAYHELTEEIEELKTKARSALEYTELVKVRNKIATDLLKYGYSQADPETLGSEGIPTITINLT